MHDTELMNEVDPHKLRGVRDETRRLNCSVRNRKVAVVGPASSGSERSYENAAEESSNS